MTDIRNEVTRFSHAMESVLKENDYKGTWKDCTPEYLLKRLYEEYMELRDAIKEKGCLGPHVRREAADVANIAMMLWDLAMIAEEGGRVDVKSEGEK